MSITTFPSLPRPKRRVALLGVLLAGTALGTWTLAAPANAQDTQSTAGGASLTEAAPHVGLPDFTSLVKYVSPAVVSITNKMGMTEASDEGPQGMPGMPGMLPFGFPGMGMPHPQQEEARGSGFIIDSNGTIVTNNHVIKNARSITVTLADGAEYPARLIGTDPRTDLAVLRINAGHKLNYLQLGDSSKVEPGEWIIAVGNPFGLGGTVTAGIVSARGRDIGEGPYDDFLQIDAPINPGNSGGPLITQDGRVVGVNSTIISPGGGSVGIGFAIPSNTVRTVVMQLQRNGHVTRGYLGVAAQPIRPDMAQALHLASGQDGQPAKGALVASVEPDSPAAAAGLQPGDVILAVNGKTVANPRDLAMDIANVAPGDSATMTVLHDGQTQSLTAKVTNLPDQTADTGPAPGDNTPDVGLALESITPELRQQLNLPSHTRGAVVAQVEPGSPADQAGIQQGDVVVGVGTRPVESPDQAASAIKAATRGNKQDHSLALRILRNGQTAFVALDLGQGGVNGDNG
jgi:serine protease Do